VVAISVSIPLLTKTFLDVKILLQLLFSYVLTFLFFNYHTCTLLLYAFTPTGMECTSTPTSSPTPFVCPGSEKRFKLSLVTDKYGSETSWKVTSPTSGDVISGSGYESYTTYTERHCIQSDACTFEISDSYGDGKLIELNSFVYMYKLFLNSFAYVSVCIT